MYYYNKKLSFHYNHNINSIFTKFRFNTSKMTMFHIYTLKHDLKKTKKSNELSFVYWHKKTEITEKTKMVKDKLLAKLFICKQQKRVSKKKVCIFSQKPWLVHKTRIMFDHSNQRPKKTPSTSIRGGNIWARKNGFRCVASKIYVLWYHTFLKRSETDSKIVPRAIHNTTNMLLA